MNYNILNNNEHDYDDDDEDVLLQDCELDLDSDEHQQHHHHNQYDFEKNNYFKQQQQYNTSGGKNLDYPPYSRLFVLYPKTATECELKNEFEKYGPIEDLWIVKDKETGLAKGIAYIKYTKASHAAKSIEDLNGKLLNNKHAKPLKVIISNSKNDKKTVQQLNASSSSSSTTSPPTMSASPPPLPPPTAMISTPTSTTSQCIDNDRMLRLFVVIPKDFRKKDLRDAFKKFGEIENVQIIFNRATNENKGFGYVRFYKASDAARALEECHPKFKPKFAEPYSVKLAREREKNTSSVKYLMPVSNSTQSLSALASQQQQQQQQQQLKPMLNSTISSSSNSSSSSSSCSNSLNNNNNIILTPHQNNNNNSFLTPPTTNSSIGNGSTSNTRLLSSTSLSSLSSSSTNTTKSLQPTMDGSSLLIRCSARLAVSHVQTLFNLIPGLIEFKLLNVLNDNDAYYIAKYENGLIASYAYDRINKFQYPTGEILNIITIDLNNLNMSLINKFSSLQLNSNNHQTTPSNNNNNNNSTTSTSTPMQSLSLLHHAQQQQQSQQHFPFATSTSSTTTTPNKAFSSSSTLFSSFNTLLN